MDNNKWLKEALDKLEMKVDRLDQRLQDISSKHMEVHLANKSSLEEHIYRTELNEENIALLREEIKPLEKNVAMVHGALKLIGLVATLGAIVEVVLKVLS